MKFHSHESILEMVLTAKSNNDNIFAVDLSPSDFHSALGEVTRNHYDHGRYEDFETDGLESTREFHVEGINICLKEDEPDV